ncbi:MAG: trehalose-6-phosphate synthase [Hyphomicrobiaceae bacterium]|nr:trehalose-6-phosphate synthase [Hyphomicrobiaceae bacterium]
MSRLIVVSNRVADLTKSVQSGGLAVALADALREHRGIWFGWDGTVVSDAAPIGINLTQQHHVRTATVPLTQRDYDEYYVGFSNNVLWPSFHYRLDLGIIDAKSIDGYRRVNQRFAKALSALLEPDDVIWVHDYHLIPLAAELRALGMRQNIGFFLHIPFPPPDIFLAVPEPEWLARAMFSYDVIGFQTRTDTANFRRYMIEHNGATEIGAHQIAAFGRTTTVRDFPIGIDVDAFHEMAHTPKAVEQIERLNRRSMVSSQIVGVDRLDYSKGLPDRLRAFRLLLELYPENRKAVTLMQISPPTREDVAAYSEIRKELEGLSGAINGEFGDFDWTPVRYIHRAVPRDTLAALFRGSQVGLVTPLRDGMNLVAKEYVAAQDADDPGVLVLSRFAGAAEDLEEAILVNPYDNQEVAQSLQRALTMRQGERRERHKALIARVRQHDVRNWRETFLEALRTAGRENESAV